MANYAKTKTTNDYINKGWTHKSTKPYKCDMRNVWMTHRSLEAFFHIPAEWIWVRDNKGASKNLHSRTKTGGSLGRVLMQSIG